MASDGTQISGTARLYLPGGGLETYTFPTQRFPPVNSEFSVVSENGLLTQARLSIQVVAQRSHVHPLGVGREPGAGGGGPPGEGGSPVPATVVSYRYSAYVRDLPDGSRQVLVSKSRIYQHDGSSRR